MLMSKNTKSKKNTDVSANYDGVYAPRIRFPLIILVFNIHDIFLDTIIPIKL